VRSVQDLTFLADETVDVVFSSNLFEHLPDKASLLAFVIEIARVLRPGGRLLVMGPNIRVLPGEYWDYFDHQIPLTEEALPRFLPYTVRSRLPKWRWLVKAYLRLGRVAWFFFGRQFFVVARKGVEP
jgi:dolichol-phosphate mannosyltransferase